MNTSDLLARWSMMSLDAIDVELQYGKNLNAALELLGASDVEELRTLGTVRATSDGPREAVVLLPGLMGSLLTSIRGKTTLLWINPAIFLSGQGHLLSLNPQGTGDGSPAVESVPFALEKLIYLKLALALNRETRLFEFPYDWRLPIQFNGDLLHRAIERWAGDDQTMQFTLVGHSMGGLVSRAYLTSHRSHAQRRVKRVIMLGTPHFGAAGAVGDIAMGNRMMAIAAKLHEHNDMRSMVLNMPSAYQLLPAPRDLFTPERPYPADFDPYDVQAWQLPGIRSDFLEAGRRFHELLADHDHPVELIQIAGCHVETSVDVKHGLTDDGRPDFQVVRQSQGSDSGDGTVPLWSAQLPGATIYYIQQVHRYLPRSSEIIRATLDLIHGNAADLPTVLPEPKGGLFDWRGPAASVEQQAEELRQHLQEGTLSNEDLEMLYFMGS